MPQKTAAQQRKDMIAFTKMMEEVDEMIVETNAVMLPDEWLRISDFVPKQPYREKVTMYLDKAMVREFKKLGPNWQSYVRAILAGYLKLAKSGIIMSRDMDL